MQHHITIRECVLEKFVESVLLLYFDERGQGTGCVT